MELYKNTDDMLRHIHNVYEMEKLEDKKSLSHRALNVFLWFTIVMLFLTVVFLLYLVYKRNMGV